jgi:hypothetical protein
MHLRSFSSFLAVALAAQILCGCAKADPTAPLPQLLRISAAQQKWKAAKLENYAFYSSVACECLDGYGGAKRVTVQAGIVSEVVDVRTGKAVPLTWRQPVDSLFAIALREVIDLPSRLEATFDPQLGYPTKLSFGRQEVDAGATIVIDSLRAIP